ncbi:MAG: phosphodiester glycosidase family protein [Clostridia bacterium]|nr:phosphodiester glycosidase family protein [Clostridia bacterium]
MKLAVDEIRKKEVDYKNEKRDPKKRKNKGSKSKKVFKVILNMAIIGGALGLFLLYGPFEKFRAWYITTAMTTMHHQYLATWFYSEETINNVLSNNRVIEVEGETDTSLINTDSTEQPITYENEYERAVLEKDQNHPEYKIIDIKEKNFEGYLAVVYDASKIHTLVTSKLNVSGQYVTTMAENSKAVLAINGGGFEDLNHNSTGGSPLGLTIANGKVITSKSYGGAGGVIGFDEDDKLVLGRWTAAQAKEKNVRDAVTCGPFLIMNGEASTVVGNGGWGDAPRTAIGQRRDGIVLWLVVDGRRVGMPGADMDDLIQIMQRYGAYNASALDGGTSSVMVENYKVINDPIDSTGAHKTRPIATGFGLILEDD